VAGVYEPLCLLVIFAICWYLWRRFNVSGYVFWIFVLLYAAMRAALSPLRLNESKVGDISVPQVVSSGTVVLAIVALYIVRRLAQRDPVSATAIQPPVATPAVSGTLTKARPRRM
jgi:prolipoprotein diacylglyceryltransferase